MHQCLCVVEIVSLICEQIEEGSLPSFARVCRAFVDPALDVLWSHQNSLGNILRCMPEGIWEEVLDEPEIMNRPVLPSDWERPLVHARRVKSFNYDGRCIEPGYPTSAEFLESLRLCWPWQQLFPNLQTLYFYSRREWTFQYVRLFLSPQIHDLFLARPQAAAHLSLLPTIAAECPLLRDLEIQYTDRGFDFKGPVSALVTGLHRLESITLPCLDNVALAHIARLPGLKSLTLENQPAIGSFPAGIFSNDIIFPALQSLDITGDDVETIIPLLALMTHARLRDLTIDLPEKIPAKRITALHSAIVRSCTNSHASLEQITFGQFSGGRTTVPTDAEITSYLVEGAKILSLATFRNLSVVFVTTPLGVDLDDTIAADLAQTWPQLSELSLLASSYVNHRSRITLQGLVPFARHCPHLYSLSLPLDATSSAWPQKLIASEADGSAGGSGRRVQQTSLLHMIVMRSPIADPLHVAGFLSSVFPKLTGILTDQHIRGDAGEAEAEAGVFSEKWSTVMATLPVLRSARMEEQKWMRRGG